MYSFNNYRKCWMCGKEVCNHLNSSVSTSYSLLSYLERDTEEVNGEIVDPQLILNIIDSSVIKPILSSNTSPNVDIKKMIPTETQDKSAFSKLPVFIPCSFCKKDVLAPYLNSHIYEHISPRLMQIPTQRIRVAEDPFESRAILLPPSSRIGIKEISTPPQITKSMEEIKAFFNKLPDPHLVEQEEFYWKEISDVSCMSSNSTNGRYSDFSLIVWFKERDNLYGNGYTGHHASYNSKSIDRLNIHFVYDSLEDYYTMIAKYIKHNSFSSYDLEDAKSPERIIEQKDLLAEVKRMLLFFTINPTGVAKRFIRCMTGEIISNTDNEKISSSYSSNHMDLFKKVNKSSETNKFKYQEDDDEFGKYACYG